MDALTITFQVSHGVNPPPPPEQAGYREGFIKDTLQTRARSGREALKCALPHKTLRKYGRTLIRA